MVNDLSPNKNSQLSEKARAILLYIVKQLDNAQDRAKVFLNYKQVHDALRLTQRGGTYGNSLDIQGLGDLARWAHANDLPAVTSLVVSVDDMQPGAKFYTLTGRKPNDLDFWIKQARRSREFNWKPYLGLVDTASAIDNTTEASIRNKDRPAQNLSPASTEPQAPRTYLLVWNPKSYEWKSLKEELVEFNNSLSLVRQWGVGNQTSIQPGDRIFFIKIGSEGARGIMGSGYSASFVYEDDHWNGQPEKKAKYIKVAFDVLIDPGKDTSSMIALETLVEDPKLSDQHWRAQSSGISIFAPVAAHLESLWQNRLDYLNSKALRTSVDRKTYYEGKAYEIVSKRYERNPEARRQCLRAHGHRCSVCSFDFQETYGELGKGFIQVHHLTPIHSANGEYQIDPERDLVPVCPNCHAMLHRQSPPLRIEELQRILRGKMTSRPV